jgi:hypothetical protein
MLENELHRKYDVINEYNDKSNKRKNNERHPTFIVEFETKKFKKFKYELNFEGFPLFIENLDELIELVYKLEQDLNLIDLRFFHASHLLTLQENLGTVFFLNKVSMIANKIDEYFLKVKQIEQSFVIIEINPFPEEEELEESDEDDMVTPSIN